MTNARFGMCQICNKAKWSHTDNEETSCTQTILKELEISDLKNKIKELKETLS